MRTSRVQLGGALRSLSALLDYCNALAPILSSIIVNSHDDDDNDDDGDENRKRQMRRTCLRVNLSRVTVATR